ncbi:MAG: polyprenyl synthetase family protein [Planctomycetes bacterium]|nr:polyprenyl synthetase family protein [Planctomycetota bacterium]
MINLQTVHQSLKAELKQFENSFNCLFAKQNGVSRKLYLYQEKVRGKRLRPVLLFLSARVSGRIKPIHFDLALIVELIHNATLMHDDVLDDARLRRYLPTINQKWGNEMAILYGDLIFSNAFKTCADIQSTEVVKVIAETVGQICHGELVHTERRFDSSLTEKDYLRIIREKTATLFATSCYLGSAFASGNKKHHLALKNYGLNFGMAYQILDDYLDFTATEKSIGKTVGTDLAKGKITLPLMRLMKRFPKNGSKKMEKMIVSLIRNSKSGGAGGYKPDCNLESVRDDILKTAQWYSVKAVESLKALPQSAESGLLEGIAKSIIPRHN